MRYFINLSFNGAPFSGWQIQKNAISVQGELQNAISTLLKEPITITGAGRTDSGVNAINYIAHFDTKNALKAELFVYKINAILPKEISVNSISEVSEEMHARFSAISRTYKYYIHLKKILLLKIFHIIFHISI
jgi:Pseudouridylate synthase